MAKKKIKIVEVGLRDGLQNEKQIITAKTKIELACRLKKAGIGHLELGAFVSPKWVPQMKDTAKVVNAFLKKKSSQCQTSVLVPNLKGMELALNTKIKEIAIFASASETFSKKNINCSIKESFDRFEQVVEIAKKNKVKVRAYLSTVFSCPYEGEVSLKKVSALTEKLFALGVYEVSLGDTIGVANPKQVEKVLQNLLKRFSKKKIAMHFHDTRGMALANIVKSLEAGITTFDSSIGGLGGCPYAKGASGNVASEDVVHMLHEMGYDTGINLRSLIQTSQWLQKHFAKDLPAKLSKIPLA